VTTTERYPSNFTPDNYAHLGPGQLVCTFGYNSYRTDVGADLCYRDNPDCHPDFHYFALDYNPSVPPNNDDAINYSLPLAYAEMSMVDPGHAHPYVRPQWERKKPFIGRLHGYIANFGEVPKLPSDPSQRYLEVPNLFQIGINSRSLQPGGEDYVRAL